MSFVSEDEDVVPSVVVAVESVPSARLAFWVVLSDDELSSLPFVDAPAFLQCCETCQIIHSPLPCKTVRDVKHYMPRVETSRRQGALSPTLYPACHPSLAAVTHCSKARRAGNNRRNNHEEPAENVQNDGRAGLREELRRAAAPVPAERVSSSSKVRSGPEHMHSLAEALRYLPVIGDRDGEEDTAEDKGEEKQEEHKARSARCRVSLGTS